MFKIRLDAGNYIKLLGNVLNRKWHKTPVSVTHGIRRLLILPVSPDMELRSLDR
jgi:hypothetical protein